MPRAAIHLKEEHHGPARATVPQARFAVAMTVEPTVLHGPPLVEMEQVLGLAQVVGGEGPAPLAGDYRGTPH